MPKDSDSEVGDRTAERGQRIDPPGHNQKKEESKAEKGSRKTTEYENSGSSETETESPETDSPKVEENNSDEQAETTVEADTSDDSSEQSVRAEVDQVRKQLMSSIDTLESQLENIESELADVENRLQDYKRRSEREREEIRDYAVENFAKEMIRVKGSLRTALDVEEFEPEKEERLRLIDKEFEKALSSANVQSIEDPDEQFDSLRHKVIDKTESENHESGEIVEIKEPGYEISGRVIRPARVVLAI